MGEIILARVLFKSTGQNSRYDFIFTLHKLIGLKFEILSGFSFLSIKTRKVLLLLSVHVAEMIYHSSNTLTN